MTTPSSTTDAQAGKSGWNTVPDEVVAHDATEGLQGIFKVGQEGSVVGRYEPLIVTLRLYAGWLLAWYFVLYAFGGYQAVRDLPFRIPLVDEFLASPLLAEASLAVFLFLLLSSVHRTAKGGALLGLSLTLLGIILVGLFSVNIR